MKWGFFPFVYNACGGNMLNMKLVFEENLYDFLQWCSYEIDLDKLKREVQKEADRKAKTTRY